MRKNKGFVKKLFLMILFISQIQAMKKEPIAPAVCHLVFVPSDVCNLIARYLTFKDRETDNEFLERIQARRKLPIASTLCSSYVDERNGAKGIASYLHDCTKILVVEKPFCQFLKSKIFTVDLKQKIKMPECALMALANNNLIVSANEEAYYLAHMVLSRDRNCAARVFQYERERDDQTLISCKSKLLVNNIRTHDVKEFDIPLDCTRVWGCEFNKQGTKVILFQEMQGQMDKEIPVTYYIVDEKVHAAKSKKTLEAYFRQNGVCKEFNKK